MTISFNWLKKYLPTTISAEKAAELLTDTGLEVESVTQIETIKGGLKGVVVGEVLTCVPHPNADRLRITTVNIGEETPLQIVCGAPNVAVGQKVPVATIGTTLYGGEVPLIIKKGKIRGEVSEGMICAEDELGLGKSHDGIMVLKADTPVGTAASDYFEIENDVVFEIGLTPNRTDAMSHFGVARDLRAALLQEGIDVPLALPKLDFKVDDHSLTIPVEVENTEACPQYLGLTVRDIQVGASPEWLQNRLRAIGLKPINNIVDATNFVLHETGHPLHAFDVAAIAGQKVLIKNVAQNTSFITLDGADRKLHANDLMICNTQEAMCLAGIFGGKSSGVNENTTSIFIESAIFNAVHIRKAAKRHGLNTDASFRYERGVDPNMTRYALMRVALLIKEIAGGKISSEIQEAIAKLPKRHELTLRHKTLNDLIGNDIAAEKVEEILTSLEFEILEKRTGEWQLSVPTYRVDVTREADVVEEFLRIYGFNRVEIPKHMRLSINEGFVLDTERPKKLAATQLTSIGFTEVMNNSLTKRAYYQKLEPEAEATLVEMLNPLSQDLNVMRQNLIFGGLEVLARNINRQTSDVHIFEFGKAYFKHGAGHYQEIEQLMLMMTGNKTPDSWEHKSEAVSLFSVKKGVMAVLARLGVVDTQEEAYTHAVFGAGIKVLKNNKTVAEIFTIQKKVTQVFDVDQPVFAAVLHWDAVVKIANKHKIKNQELPKYPSVSRDLAVLVDVSTTYESLRAAAQKAGGKLLKNINLFDVYTGKNLPEGKKSYALSFVLQDPSQTLVDKKVDQTMGHILAALQKECGAQLR